MSNEALLALTQAGIFTLGCAVIHINRAFAAAITPALLGITGVLAILILLAACGSNDLQSDINVNYVSIYAAI